MAKVAKRFFLVEPDIKTTLEFKVAVWLLAVCIVGVAMLGLTSKFPPGRQPLAFSRHRSTF
jgi:hypothetical protein